MVRGGRDEAGLQPSEDQFWPLPWGVDVTSVAAKKQCGLDVVLYLFSFIFQELIILPCYLVFIVLAAALFIRNLT